MNPSMESIYNALIQGDMDFAQTALVSFLNTEFGLKVTELEFQQSAVSLNSFKGVFSAEDGRRYFFKTHIEAAGEVAEYAGAQRLAEVGYPIISPIYVSTQHGKELLVYPLIEDPSLFDVVVALRRGTADISETSLREGQRALDQRLWACYQRSFEARMSAFPAVQQLFYRRLVGPRFDSFYRGKSRNLGGGMVDFETLESSEWTVNGRSLGRLKDWLDQACSVLSPESMLPFTVIGHGDAHNGNVFFNPNGFRYFDPAYAGRHDPFLDLTKPLFHNTFARWMYFPEEVQSTLSMEVAISEGIVKMDHDFVPNAVEQAFFDSKVQEVLSPLIRWLDQENLLPVDWEARLRSSLLCCPLLTVNLFDEHKYSPEVAALGFAMVGAMATFDFKSILL